jgi:hypothetical protein
VRPLSEINDELRAAQAEARKIKDRISQLEKEHFETLFGCEHDWSEPEVLASHARVFTCLKCGVMMTPIEKEYYGGTADAADQDATPGLRRPGGGR